MDKKLPSRMTGMIEDLEPQEQVKLEALLKDVQRLRERTCKSCEAVLCGHEALMSFAMGFKDAPMCWPCLAETLGYSKEALRDQIFAYIKHRSCHYEGWLWANREEGFGAESLPYCLWPEGPIERCGADLPDPRFTNGPIVDGEFKHDLEWDAGGMSCGDLVLELRIRLQPLQPGKVIKLTATDAGASEDLPAWCRMTGNILLFSKPPVYIIRRKVS